MKIQEIFSDKKKKENHNLWTTSLSPILYIISFSFSSIILILNIKLINYYILSLFYLLLILYTYIFLYIFYIRIYSYSKFLIPFFFLFVISIYLTYSTILEYLNIF